ncbi:hypothetical protein CALCODRAFT_84019 [Calocera cornea HHB12733]|uniref:DH domain-containing protein n=1 Tax=Calocera cornea HHB12733 TaxID=1353952 RepID=A0A165ILW4_9BASI|nr:hypothetical protein CALCODRAFT_84019 [Calocera cornea HHB12733]
MALLAPPASRLPPTVVPPPLRGPLQPSASEPDLSYLRSPPLPLPPGAMPPVVVARSQHIPYAAPRRRISLSRRPGEVERGGDGRSSGSSSSSSTTTLVGSNGPHPPRGKVGALLHRFPSLRRSGSRSSSSSSSPSATSSPALSPPASSPRIPAAPPMTTSASLPISHPSPTHSHLPVSPPSAWSGGYVLPTPPSLSPLSMSPLSTSPLGATPPQAMSPRRSLSSPTTATTANPAPHRLSSTSDGDDHPTPKLSAQKRAQTMPVLPRTHAKRFYGLMEVVETERNYVRDLVLLVDVYLPALYAVDPILYPFISRNLPSLRAAHVSFLQELENALRVAGLPSSTEPEDLMQMDYSTDEEPARIAIAVGRISRAFFLSTDVWALYDEYCTQHTAAMAALDRLSTRMGAEWKAIERRCMSMATGAGGSPRGSMDHSSRPGSPTLGGESDRERGRPPKKQLSLHDLLIEPVQRICRYPLLLAKLLPPELRHSYGTNGMHGPHEEHGVKELRAAYSVMREIVSRVDEARERHERELRGERISVRVEGPQINESLMLSLGPPLLVGALDVLVLPRSFAIPPSSSNASVASVSTVATITPMSFAAPAAFSTAPGVVAASTTTANLPSKVRYLGAFLYAGCLLLVKPKKANLYEARHWLELANCQLVQPTPDDPPLLNSFCLTKDDKNFYFAVSCAQEKSVWLPAIAQAIAQEQALGENAMSAPFFRAQDDEDTSSPILMQPPVLLPHSQSISASSITSPVSLPPVAGALALRRPTQQQRQIVDRCLADVYSESCLAARAGAALFPDSATTAPTGFSRIMYRDSLLSSAAGSDKENSPAPAEKKRRRLSTRSFTGLSASETFTAEEPALTSVPEDVHDEDAPTITHRRQRTYSYTMSSVRDALHVGRARPASVQNILNLQTSGFSGSDNSRSPPASGPGLTRSATLMAFLSARQRTKSAPVTPGVSSPTEPIPAVPLNNRPPPVDTTPIATSADPSPNSDPTSALEFSATGRYRDRLESFPGSAEGGSQDGVLSDMTDPSASEESALAPPSPPEVAQHVHVRIPSNELESLVLPAQMAPMDGTKVSPSDTNKTYPLPAQSTLSSAPSTLRRKNTGSFFMRFNPFASAAQ